MVSELVLGERARQRGICDPEAVHRLVGEHLSGSVDHTERLWALINFELWQRRFLDGEEEVRTPHHGMTRHGVEARAGQLFA